MKKLLLLALVAGGPMCACVQITDTLGALGVSTPGSMNGSIDLTIRYTTTDGSGGGTVVQSRAVTTVTNGALSYCAPAGSTITAAYSVRNSGMAGSTTFTRYWIVPSTGGPFTVRDVEVQVAPTPSLAILFAQFPTPPSSGTYCIQSVSGVISWGTCTGSTPTGSWSALTSSTWSALNASSWSALTQ